MKTGIFFLTCADCIFYVGGECAEGRGFTSPDDGCEQIYFYDCKMSEYPDTPPQKMFRKAPKEKVTLNTFDK